MLKKLSSTSLGRLILMERDLGYTTQVNLSLRRGSIIKNLPWGTRIAFPFRILKEVDMLFRGVSVLHVGGNTWVGVMPTWIIALDAIIGVFRSEIVIASRQRGNRTTKLTLMDRMLLLQRRIIFYALQDSKGAYPE